MTRLALACAALALSAVSAAAQPKDPDWPCEQRKVSRLSIGQMWTGELPDALPEAAFDPEVEALAARLAARRTTLEQAETLVAEIGASDAAPRDARLAALFAETFETIDRERTRLVEGVTRYAQGQRALADRIDARQAEIARLEAETAEDDFDALDRLDELRDELAWDVRIYEERNGSLRYVCESPVILERRAFALARVVKAAMGGG